VSAPGHSRPRAFSRMIEARHGRRRPRIEGPSATCSGTACGCGARQTRVTTPGRSKGGSVHRSIASTASLFASVRRQLIYIPGSINMSSLTKGYETKFLCRKKKTSNFPYNIDRTRPQRSILIAVSAIWHGSSLACCKSDKSRLHLLQVERMKRFAWSIS